MNRTVAGLGPYEDSLAAMREARDTWYDQNALYRSHTYSPGGPGSTMREQARAALLAECEAAGLTLGAYDRRILDWLGDWDVDTVQVVLGLIRRASIGRRPPSD